MSLLRRKLLEFKNDKLLQATVVLSFVFFALHVIGYFDSNGKFEVIVRAAAILSYPLFVFIAGRSGLRVWGILYAYILFWFTGTLNYTPFIVLALLCVKCPLYWTVAVFLVYAVIVSVRSTVNDIAPFRVIFHALKCCVFYFGIKIILENKEKPHSLELLPDEILILEELAKGKNINEITIFSTNTVCKKLKAARERNGLTSNEELLLKYTN